MGEHLPTRPLIAGAHLLQDLLGIPEADQRDPAGDASDIARFNVDARKMALAWKSKGDVAQVAAGIRLLKQNIDDNALLVLLVPFMGNTGQALCEKAQICWLDLSGNAHLVAPGLRIVIKGNPNKFKRAGRPSTAFAPKSSRLVRWLLMSPPQGFTQRQLSKFTGVDQGFTSRILGKLLDENLLIRSADNRIEVPSKTLLLKAWAEEYRFDKHRIRKGHIPARSGTELTSELTAALQDNNIAHAFTGLAAAWQISGFAAYRLTTVYLSDAPSPKTLANINFRDDPRGANTWLVTPNDEGVFHGAGTVNGVRCAHPVQIWLDLLFQPERAPEAAEVLEPNLFSEHKDCPRIKLFASR